MATLQEVDIRLVLERLRPRAEYHWKGDTDTGYAALSEAVGDWRDVTSTLPTEAELLAEWEVCLSEQAAQATKRAALMTLKAAADKARNDPETTIQEQIDALEKQVAWLMALQSETGK